MRPSTRQYKRHRPRDTAALRGMRRGTRSDPQAETGEYLIGRLLAGAISEIESDYLLVLLERLRPRPLSTC